ncbi:hypothetical protein SPRG_13428 [Saprolegnia parasitica CBS 223.65]|uniref:BolA protein n=1 Tax=Saprolegnia parasitica (strain CBS 223.65) TaxID=695850 RepID=A0A067C2D2_SAPPC|nr:hypothetical protein SPRG_13428 [Saprolegnia parasitica CBS 223.65]KDO20676.1 hypothetical protein SPRG_13428 [Saprolegnia parasitica CBS 223.65]|eukprot:XP_012208641.1 hypothetical protein SPRG_13428 [Saprolegnia parasitica CBS 223.65]
MMMRAVQRVLRPASARGLSTTAEEKMATSLRQALSATHVKVDDISGGCGSMYKIEVASPTFEGKNRVAQHRLVNEVLKEEIGGMHGLTLKTYTPAQFEQLPK